MSRQFWDEDDFRVLEELYPHRATKHVAAVLGRSVSSVYGMAQICGLTKTAEFLAGPESGILRKGETRPASVATQFKKGVVPANKGLRRPGWHRGRMRETQFKRGERTGAAARNWKPVGTIATDTEGYQRIKVREHRPGEHTGFGNTEIWPLLHRHVWEQHHGPIPPHHAVAFRDGKRANCAIENLELISRADLARRNAMWHRFPEELINAIQLNGALKRRIRRLGNGKEQNQ